MSTTRTQHLGGTYVPPARFGTALAGARHRQGASLAGLARSAATRCLPDHLASVERGEVSLGDDDITGLASLYRLTPRRYAGRHSLVLRLDRSTSWDLRDTPQPEAGTLWQCAARLAAISDVLGHAVVVDAKSIEHLSVAFDTNAASVLDALAAPDAAPHGGSHGRTIVGDDGSVATDRVVVPEAGLRLIDCLSGCVALVRARHATDEVSVTVPAVCTLGDFAKYLTP